MKHLLTLLIAIIVSLQLQAQNYLPMAVDSSYWLLSDNYNCGNFGVIFDERRVNYYLYGDTTISSINYKKVYRRTGYKAFCGDTIPPSYSPFQLYGVMRDDTLNKKVYAILFQNLNGTPCPINQEFMLYDFDLQVGDSIKTNDWCLLGSNAEITQIQQTNIYSINTTEYWVSFYNSNPHLSFYQGIGYGPFDLMFQNVNAGGLGLYQYCRGGCDIALGLGNKTFLPTEITISPNPNNGIFNIALPTVKDEIQVSIYNLSGQQIKNITLKDKGIIDISKQPNGVYFVKVIHQQKVITQKIIKY
jgi:hypothetical protein